MNTETEFLEELACHHNYWVNVVVNALINHADDLVWTDSPDSFERLRQLLTHSGLGEDLRQVLSESMRGLIHSILLTLDGGTALGERTKLILSDSGGNEFSKDLHNHFVARQLDTGRLE